VEQVNASRAYRVLSVEDEPDIQAIIKMCLEAHGGFEVMSCSSGPEALSVAENFAPDLFLLDVMMPGMDGPATLAELHRNPALADVPAIFLTAKVRPQDLASYFALGAKEVITKPFDPTILPGRLLAILEGVGEVSMLDSHQGEAEIEDELAALKEEFISVMAERIEEIDALLVKIGEGEWDGEAAGKVRFLAHKLAGSAGCFGYEKVSETARALENAFDEWLEGRRSYNASAGAQALALFAALDNSRSA